MSVKCEYEITSPFQRLHRWSLRMNTSNVIPHFIIDLIIHPCLDQSQSMLIKGAPEQLSKAQPIREYATSVTYCLIGKRPWSYDQKCCPIGGEIDHMIGIKPGALFNIRIPSYQQRNHHSRDWTTSLTTSSSLQVRYLMRGINGEKLGLKCLNVGKILTI